MKRVRRFIVGTGALVALGLVIAACGGSSNSTGTQAAATGSASSTSAAGATSTSASSSGKVTTLKTGVVPASSLVTAYMGDQQGYWTKAGLALKQIPGETAAALIAQVLSGQLNITFAPSASVIAADAAGAHLQMIANQGGLIAPGQPSSAILVNPDSGITSPKDLVGKKVGVIALKSELDVLMHIAVQRAGGDQSQVQSVQIPFPDMLPALQAHRVDAIVTSEPFMTIALKAGMKDIGNVEEQLLPKGTTGTWAATTDYIKSHEALIKAFQKANAQSIDYTRTHVTQARAALPKITSMKPALAQIVKLGLIYTPKVDTKSVLQLGDYMKQLGYINAVPPISELVAPQNY
jgi:NitT/TauT family transport system substrate-binding protein